MFVYLSKKIAIPQQQKLKSLSWNSDQGWIACGGEGPLLKVLKLESSTKDPKAKGGASSNLSMNQTLEGHQGGVMCVCWNEIYRKLTTSDGNGLIIVWMLHKGLWFEEMINNRNKSVVTSMGWTSDGQKICIVYEDGAVIVGSVDGNRLWGKDIKNGLVHVEWSPDGRHILFGTVQGEVHLYDNTGNYISKVPLFCVDEDSQGERVIAVDWYDGCEGLFDPNAPTLAIVFENGRAQLMRSEADEKPVLLDTDMRVTQAHWNCAGSVLAIAGTLTTTAASGETKEVSMVQFYNPFGQHLRSLKVPGGGINALSWEGNSLRIALAVESFIYFANIRPDYKWGYFSNTLVYSYNKQDRAENCVVFWDTKENERYIKYVKKLLAIRACGENCVLATRAEEQSGQYILILCNAIGSPVDCKYIDVEPLYITMTKYHVIVGSEDRVYVWQYRTLVSKLTSVDTSSTSLRRKEGRERTFHIDDVPSANAPNFEGSGNVQSTSDSICALAASDKMLVVGRESGTVCRYTLPHVSLEHKYVLRCRPQLLALNCNSTRMSIIDMNGILTFFDLDTRPEGSNASAQLGEHLSFERKDVWDMKWADDNPELFAMMEKTRMYIFRGLDPEEPLQSSAYLCEFNNLEIKTVLMDEIMQHPDNPDKEVVMTFETKSLRDSRQIITNVSIKEAYAFIEDHPHPRLWRLLAESSLERLDFTVADKAFVRCNDYQGIQFVKRLKVLDDKKKQRAEIAAYFEKFMEAESLYVEIDRKDLAVELRMRLGDWFRVVSLVQSGGGDDTLLLLAYNKIGDYYADRSKWPKAAMYYAQAKNNEKLVDCFYMMEDYTGLEKLIHALPEGNEYLKSIGEKLASVGLSEKAVQAFVKSGDVKAAIDTCVVLNQWDQAVTLAERYDFQQIEGLLTKYAHHLLEKKKPFQAIELYRKANRHSEAAKLLNQLAKEEALKNMNPVRVKKLYVLAALEMDRFRGKMLDLNVGHTTATSITAQTLEGLMEDDAAAGSQKFESAWHGAEGYHLFMMAQQQLYSEKYDFAMRTTQLLKDYEDVIDPGEVFSLAALSAYFCKHYGQASKAFIRLEALEGAEPEKLEQYRDLAMQIFLKHPPTDPSAKRVECPRESCKQAIRPWELNCNFCGADFTLCVASGRVIHSRSDPATPVYKCRQCKHYCLIAELKRQNRRTCPLCHISVKDRNKDGTSIYSRLDDRE